MKKIIFSLIVICLTFVSGCNDNSSKSNIEGKVKVTVTIGQIGDAVKNIGGDKVEVSTLMGPGVDPHLYKATQSDMKKIHDADIVFYNGLHLEGKMLDALSQLKKTKVVYAIAETVNDHSLLKTEEKTIDPHIWFDIQLWKEALQSVVKGLMEVDPENKEYYEEQAENYFKQLDDLYNFSTEKMDSIPEQKRILITAHDAFGYFGNAYGLEVMGLQGLSTDSEYGLADIKRIVDTLVERKIQTVFVETSVNDKSIQAVIEGAKSRNHEVKIGGELFSDAMGEEGTEEGTYIGMYKHNIQVIYDGLK